ncbi:P-loop containing nucleoside triphosphate hydrolase [Pseudocohnilembus persalinus]|uniref:UMP-CMP kinase n=1 Tax=Pseudocohnilembus persalinus TaxID=266149 RepID=A0A0V0QYV2_PSEPJ|nr:P-loop containing nucleoside triphosphate hydrolase [Pseudocohnilembus persalinus]|eukprot:KRX07406.1 P-loop containing nucleoside triphosphate hydrolase [Pseudocohnilembus persalinus]
MQAIKPRVVFVLGGPGSGKGTQCARLVNNLGFKHLSAGDLLREERKSGSKDGDLIESIITQGKIVPSEITVGLLKKGMENQGWNSKFLIDGFPRNQENFDVWQKIMGELVDFRFVLYFECSFDTMTQRVNQRSLNSGRSDDDPEILKKRFVTYIESTKPIIDFYQTQGKLVTADAEKDVEQVYQQILPEMEKI